MCVLRVGDWPWVNNYYGLYVVDEYAKDFYIVKHGLEH